MGWRTKSSMAESTESVERSISTPHLSRVLGLWDLIFYGMVLISPVAPVPLFGLAQTLSHGFTATCILIAMGAMAITAVSYGRMATLHPSAGSAYTYVGQGLNPHLGFLIGWAMFLDYFIQPILSGIYGALTIQRLLPGVPYVVLAAGFVGLMTYLNLQSIRGTARANEILLVIMTAVIGIFIVMAIRYLFRTQGVGSVFSVEPFYDPHTFQLHAIATGTSLAALTYIGFDGVTLLAEEVKDPKRNVLLASVLVCIFTGLFSVLQVYLAQRVWPDYRTFRHMETAFMDVAGRVGHVGLFDAIAVILVVSFFGTGLTGQLGAARLLFSMGRDKVLPQKLFACLNRSKVPAPNILIIGALAFFATQFLTFELAAELLNFGAFLAFMGVNLASFVQFYVVRKPGRSRHFVKDAVIPLLGFLFCLWIWLNLSKPAKVVGGIWLGAGFAYAVTKTRGFRSKPLTIDFRES
jgi:putrescine importer